jgi:chromosome segregation ATPase
MATIEERVADLEGKMIPDLRDEMRRGFEQMSARFDAVNQRFDAVDKRFDAANQRFDGVDKRLDRIESRVERIDDRADRHFMWIVGIQFTMMMIFIGALLAAVLRAV